MSKKQNFLASAKLMSNKQNFNTAIKQTLAKIRWFTVVNAKFLKKGKYEISNHDILSVKNRFKVDETKRQTPINAAEKALSKICKRIKNEKCSYDIVLRETTQKSNHKLFFYSGKRILLPKNKWKKAVFKKDRYGVKLDTPLIKYFKYKIEIIPVSSSELKHANPLSGWKLM